MIISFKNQALRRQCLEEAEATRSLGRVLAKKLRSRLADLDAAESVSALVAGRPHPLKHDRVGQFALELDRMKRLVFEPAEAPPPLAADGSVDWSQVRSVRIVYIGDYHD